MNTGACPFCAIIAGNLPASRVWEGATAIAFMDLRQAVSGHVLIVPRQHVETLDAMDEETAAHLMRLAVRIAKASIEAFAPPGFNLWQSNGEAGGQEVPHVHLHVQPRRIGDGLLRIYPEAPPSAADVEMLDALAAALRVRLGQA